MEAVGFFGIVALVVGVIFSVLAFLAPYYIYKSYHALVAIREACESMAFEDE